MKPRIAFLGTPELTVEYLSALSLAGMTPVVIVTNPDRPSGRGRLQATPPAPKLWALSKDILVLQPEKINDEFFEEFQKLNIDISIVVAYGSIIPEKIINLPKYGTLNVHYSLLPKFRGASPVEAAILSGDTKTGVSIQKMKFKLDTGPIIAEEETPIDPDETAPELKDRLNKIAVPLLLKTLPDYFKGKIIPKEQDENFSTHVKKFSKEDGLLDLSANPLENYKKYRAYFAWPRTYFFIEKDSKKTRVIITQASYSNNQFKIEKVLPEGKKEISYSDFLRNNSLNLRAPR